MTPTSIHASAVIHPKAQIGHGCDVGPYCVIGENVLLGRNCKLHSHVVIGGETILGDSNEIFAFASIGLRSQDLKWKGGRTRVRIGDHNTFRECVTVHSATADGNETVIGSHNHFLASTHVAHDCQIGNHVVVSNATGIAGHVVVEDYVVIGGVVGIHQFCRLGKMCIVGGCSKVVQDVPPFMMADGNPAETRTINKVGLERNGVSDEVKTALRQAHKILFRDGLIVSNALSRIEEELPPLPEITYLVEFVRHSERGLSR